MKTTLVSCLALTLLALPAFAQEASRPDAPDVKNDLTAFPQTAYQLAAGYLRSQSKTEAASPDELLKSAAFAEYLDRQGLKPSGRMAGAVAKLVVVAVQAARREEVEPDLAKPAFQLLLQESLAQALQVSSGKLPASSDSAPAPDPGLRTPKPAGAAESAETGGKPATKEEVKETVETIVKQALEKDAKADFKNIQSYFHTGVTLLNPYKIPESKPPLTVAPASETDVHAYLEFVYTNRWAWNEERIRSQFDDCAEKFVKFIGPKEGDIQARVGYTFSTEDSPTANTLTGSGDFNAEISAAWPFFVSRAPNGQSAFSVGLEAGYGAVTEKAALRAHQNAFVGLAYATSFKDPLGSKDAVGSPRRVLVHFRLGQSWLDSVRYVSETSNEIHSVNNGLPRYFREETPGFEVQLLYPVKNSTFISFAGKVYPELQPGQWTMQIGVTTSFSDLLDGFFK